MPYATDYFGHPIRVPGDFDLIDWITAVPRRELRMARLVITGKRNCDDAQDSQRHARLANG
jgi:hypothetical protein